MNMTQNLTGRVERLRRRMLDAEHARHRIFLPQDWSVRDLPCGLAERKGHAMKLMLERMPIFIDDEELIVGGRTVFGRPGADFDRLDRPPKPSNDLTLNCFPAYARPDEIKDGHCEGCSQGHYVPNYPKVIRLGFGGIRAQAEARLSTETDPARNDFLRAVYVTFEGAGILARRYADLAESMTSKAAPERVRELKAIASACRHIASEPPQTFHEACQLTFFVHLLAVIENHWLLSQGRMDQYLLPMYCACDPSEATTLMQCLLIKLNDQGDVRMGDLVYDGEDNVVLGGLLPSGSDGVNELTYALLDSLADLNLPNPEIAARVHRNSPSKYIERLAGLSVNHFGQLAYFNDDAFVPSLEGIGFSPGDARDYVLDACQDVLIDGKSSFFVLSAVTLTGIVLEILAEADDSWTFARFLTQCKERIAEIARRDVENYNAQERLGRQVTILPFVSGTMDDCIEKGVDMTRGGLHFLNKGMMVVAPVTAINSLVAIRQVVYEQRFAKLSELKAALAADWEGHEALRQKCIHAPKWGNDDDSVDLLGKDIIEFACREIMKYRTSTGARILAGVHQPHSYAGGLGYQATPDGRHNRDVIPVTLSPANGTDRNGPTAVMKSATKIDPMLCQWNSALLMNFHPSAVRGAAGLHKFISLLKTFFAMGGMQLQLNVVDSATLKAAQLEPEKHRDLVVRVWGVSIRFVELCKGYQDDVIARTEHAL